MGKDDLEERNEEIFNEFNRKKGRVELARKFKLSVSHIDKIIRHCKDEYIKQQQIF